MTSQALTVTDQAGLINHISDAVLRLLIDKRIVDDRPWQTPVFYAWPRGNRLVCVLDPVYIKRPEAIMHARFRHHLSLVLSQLPVAVSNHPVLAVQVGFAPIVDQVLISRRLNLTEQPDPLAVPLGVTKRSDLWLSIVEMDSVLIGSPRGMGKTTLLHTWIQALDHGDACEIWIWDGKADNVEFRGYRGRPNIELIGHNDLLKYLIDLRDMMNDRSSTFTAAGATNLAEYNRAVAPDRAITPIVLIIDELAEIHQRADAAEIFSILCSLINVGRSAGIHPVLATQRPDAKTIGAIKANLKTRIAFAVTSHTESRIVLERIGAEKIEKTPGRFLMVWGASLIEGQTFLTDKPKSATSSAPEPVAPAQATGTFAPQAAPTAADLALALRCKQENSDRFTEEWLRSIGYSQNQARDLRRIWRDNEWIRPDASLFNKPLVLSEYIYALILDLTTDEPRMGTDGHGWPTDGAD